MDSIYEHMEDRLKNKKEELKREQDYFKCMVENEINTSNFERNAMSVLNVMQCLKSEISELEHYKMIYRVQNGITEA